MVIKRQEVAALVIGGGPAGLAAAEVLSAAGHAVLVAEAKPSLGRKLLMAGKSGLNLTKAEPFDQTMGAYGAAADWLRPMLTAFGPDAVQDWATGLGQPVFTGSTGRVFPVAMKASPLLRAWIGRLSEQGVTFATRWRWTGWDEAAAQFDTPQGQVSVRAQATVLALGGASWARLGSDGAWAPVVAAQGGAVTPFAPANAGLSVTWSSHMARQFGQPLKNIALHAGEATSRGEVVISARGLEGGGVYPLTPALRSGAALTLDLCPDLIHAQVQTRLSQARGKATLANHMRKRLGLGPAHIALLQEFGRPLPAAPEGVADLVKAVPVTYAGVRPMDEAISTAGGVAQSSMDDRLMLIARPGVFCAGEMLDWEAPTGGYLLTGCLASGRWAGQGAADWLAATG